MIRTKGMVSARRRRVATTLGLAVVLASLAVAPAAQAQQRRSILWLVEVAEDSTVDRSVAIELFQELLTSAADAVHLVDAPGLAEYVEREGYPLPGCLTGREPCEDIAVAVAERLRLDVIASVRVFGEGRRMVLTVRSGVGGSTRTLEFNGANLRATAFQVVTDFIGATASLAITSRPTGATVLLNDEVSGQTPYQSQVPAGIYRLRLELEGYQPFEQVIELRPSQSRLVDTDLLREYALVSVPVAVDGATVWADGELLGDAPGPFQLDPGTYTIRIEAPDRTPEERRLELEPGVDRQLRIDLRESPEAIRRRRMGYIYARPFYLRGAFQFSGSSSGLSDATGSLAGADYTVDCPRAPDGTAPTCTSDGIPINAVGFNVSLGYSFTYVEVAILSVAYTVAKIGGSSIDGRALILTPDSGDDTVIGRVSSLSQLGIYPLWIGGRYLFTDSWSIFGRAGFGWYAQYFEVTEDVRQVDSGDFRRTGFTWNFDVGVRYHLNDTVYLEGAFGLGGDLGHDDTSLTKSFTVGIAVTWPDFLGIDRLFSGDDDDADEEDVPPSPTPRPPDEEGAPPAELGAGRGLL